MYKKWEAFSSKAHQIHPFFKCIFPEAVACSYSEKRCSWIVRKYSEENTCARASFLILFNGTPPDDCFCFAVWYTLLHLLFPILHESEAYPGLQEAFKIKSFVKIVYI